MGSIYSLILLFIVQILIEMYLIHAHFLLFAFNKNPSILYMHIQWPPLHQLLKPFNIIHEHTALTINLFIVKINEDNMEAFFTEM